MRFSEFQTLMLPPADLLLFVILPRCYLVWGKSWKVVTLPLILLVGFVGKLCVQIHGTDGSQ